MIRSLLKGIAMAALAVVAFQAACDAARAQSPMTISVVGEGVSATAPDYVIVKGIVPGRGETTVAAHKAYEAAKTALEKEFPAGGPLGEIKFLGERFSTPATGMEAVVMAAPGGAAVAAPEAKPGEVGEKVQFRIDFSSEMDRTGVAQRVAAVIDRAGKAGVEFTKPNNIYTVAGRQGTALTEFTIEDPGEATIKACEAAVKEARAKAERLAAAAGGKLGDIVSIEEIGSDRDPTDAYSTIVMLSMGETPSESEFSSDSNQRVEVRRKMRVVFSFSGK